MIRKLFRALSFWWRGQPSDAAWRSDWWRSEADRASAAWAAAKARGDTREMHRQAERAKVAVNAILRGKHGKAC